ncbi:ATP-dependent DNA ligase [Candidatus Babeliales bacterium]|nr:ATP-dependent DNA ligase [Candidatus Babeliales bacterium]
MKFKVFAEFLQKLEFEPSRNAMTKILAELFDQCSPQEIKIVCYFCSGSLYAPYDDKQFNIANKGIIEILAHLLNVSVHSIEKDFKKLGDFGLVVQALYQGHDKGLTILEVYHDLVAIADIVGTGSTEKKYHEVQALLKKLDPLGAKFVIRMISKTLRLGFSDMTILDGLSWMESGNKKLTDDLEHAYNICADLGLVAQAFKQKGIDGIKNMQIHIGIPIRPAAAERLKSASAIVEKLGHCVAQPKLDGFRVQVHVKKSESHVQVHFFSRNLLDMSDMFPDLKKLVSHLHVQSLICEGEAIVYDQGSETFLPFQQTVKRKRKHDVEQASQDLPLRLYLFDILYLDGHSLLNKTHEQRRAALQKLLHSVKDESLQIIDEKKINTASELEHYFLQNIQAGLEGLVVKRADSIYQPGKRNFNWIKLKRESHATLIDTVDVVILGYYMGEGKRAKFGIGAFLVGVYDAHRDQFETVAKVGTGMSDEEWKALKKRCDVLKISHQPKNVICAKELYPDVWVDPEIVCSVKADEITWSPLHTAGKTDKQLGIGLRFPRFIQYREDKSAGDATTVAELHKLFQQQKVKS